MTSGADVEFHYDFSSPYGFMAAQRIGALAARHGRGVEWNPILLGVVFKQTGSMPLTEVPLKGEYAKRDFARSARFHGLSPFRMPPRFPIPTQVPARIVTWVKQAAPSSTEAVTLALFRAYFEEHVDISTADAALAAAARAGIDPEAARAAIDGEAIRSALKAAIDRAIGKGVFGSPFIIVDGEPFWGLDRLDQVERWLERGGF